MCYGIQNLVPICKLKRTLSNRCLLEAYIFICCKSIASDKKLYGAIMDYEWES